MHPDFWKALEQLGSLGAARADWKHRLGEEWHHCARFLEPTGQMADSMRHPDDPSRLLTLECDDNGDWWAIDFDEPGDPPIQVPASDVAELQPCWPEIGAEVGRALGFATADWQDSGPLRRIGTLQDSRSTQPAYLFLPPGCFSDLTTLVRALLKIHHATVFLPGNRWFHPDVLSLAATNELTLHEICALTENSNVQSAPAAYLTPKKSTRSETPAVKPVIRFVTGMQWSEVVIEVRSGRTISIKAGEQIGEYRFPSNSGMQPHSPLGILMQFAVEQRWSTPPSGHQHHRRNTKSFQRLRDLLEQLIPLPGRAFRHESGAYVPKMTVTLHPDLAKNHSRPRPTTTTKRR